MPTTAGSVAFNGSFPKSDAFVTRRLREAGAIILGKATMTEFANFLTNGMPSGYSSLGGYGFNPFDPRPDPRTFLDARGRPTNDGRPVLTPGGSSSGPGIAVSANLAAVGIGTETSGSILSPGTANGVVGIKPTVGLVSRDGIIPIAADQDTAGPLARTVRDAAIVLGVIAGFDPHDPVTSACLTPGNCFRDYTQSARALPCPRFPRTART
jgi:amidase